MIKVETYEKAKSLTQSIHEFYQGSKKTTLNAFRTHFSKQFGFEMMKDAYKEQEKRREEILSKYITFIDDERITIDVARQIASDKFSEDQVEENAEKYFSENLKGKEDEVNFPIKDTTDLIKRCQEILILFNEVEWFSQSRLAGIIYKISLEKGRIGYKYNKENKEEFFENPELAFAIEFYNQMFQYRSTGIFNLIELEDSDFFSPEDGYYSMYSKMKLFTRALIWTQSNVGSCLYETARKKARNI